MLETLLPILIFTALALAVIGAVRRIRLWRQGRPSRVSLFKGLVALPRRYLVDLHHVVGRDKMISNTHVATAGGFVAAAVLMILVHGLGIANPLLGGLLLLASASMFVGSLFVARRRLNPPARLSKGSWMRLPKSLMAFSLGVFLITLPTVGLLPEGLLEGSGSWLLALVLAGVVAWGLGEMFFGMTWGGPMKHAFAGALHLAFHRRAERFSTKKGGAGRSTGLKALNLEDEAAPLGVEKPADFTWNQLLGFDACVQCGRCEAVCPAFAAGQPLNPKKLIQDMVVGMAGGSDAAYAGSPHPSQGLGGKPVGEHAGSPHGPIVALQGKALVDADTLWSCTTCRACVEECPMMIEHVDAIVDMRRHLTLERGKTPNKGAEVLDNLIATDNPGGFDPGSRLNWAADLSLPLMADLKQVDVLLWLGDGAFDMRNQRTLRALVKVLRAAEVDFAVLGTEERDSGDVARRLGDEATFQSLAKRNIATLAQYRFLQIVTCDPHSFHVLGNEYGELGGHYEVRHHSTFIAELFDAGRLTFASWKGGSVTYHDPCYLGRYNGEYEAPRNVLKALGIEVKEMERSSYRSRCCGGGGGAPITDIPGKQRIPDMRMNDVKESGAELVAVGCPQCTAMLEGVVDASAEVRDIAELVADALVERPAGDASDGPRRPAATTTAEEVTV
ncbi:(Fe-S)-binding protein [Halomonas profundus]|uniref:Iron-sulfur-binding oxidoreductase FadF n=1 Tax=Vreelandella titanicae TaxID=664683 RepID=A0AAP9T1F0_9GAMM|nr:MULTISPECIES: (Fe-S)-binding protein [Halomonas]QKS25759.1 putative iron-sulfur-binding oxidoreductase FadF [Halomonas titanicae]UEQ03734.1 (Fe-S)-binding protein [Halomonas profundus]CDG53041.1 Iron-sulfur cluster-binding protein [Halomonas sp. A3H3]SDI68704.1 Fe-S oxidoreductase [Halomonas titanicae]